MKEIITHSEEETMKAGEQFAKTCKPGDIIGLKGQLGAGKTHFVKGFVRAFGLSSSTVTSPTFTLIQEYEGTLTIWHFDCYRVKDPKEILEIGAEEYFFDQGICIIEWPEKIQEILPQETRFVSLITQENRSRKILLDVANFERS
ncbi:MAG: tRNA (adenosine(37)-N6)-threonylcarbamoyltransferase complex ATPase subunit type 1 TsaE [Bacteroidetes bacterium]|jgi:tRNA threonylcarbamoyladenosine biosynthesis protein TsaE|nr:tRNA (adenosine(37)-N6)-threonylcarbamoyltransferase complex ATPase subunit type 1 TsaE [Bacteroidota bacterium]PTM09048.1 MAG: tRNA (adenosine(37)-N6)-threonylcarbamoyltransferase complex ATPase subunit type 1 TsaE [Bacteroidota bacterium]PTM20169.1 MAG: tRNA (adenosine(37)-N6)-threonylcarbamoyltransferase complex ATPase subunit type 1 TsaE [Bacteroidota bacterium]